MYITLEELNTITPTLYLSSELNNVGWGDISETDKEVLITRSGAFLDSLDYEGYNKELIQNHKFPRYIDGVLIEVNDNVKKAQVSIIYEMLKAKNDTRKQLRKQGVKSIDTGGTKESYTDEIVEEIDSSSYKGYIGNYLFRGVIDRI